MFINNTVFKKVLNDEFKSVNGVRVARMSILDDEEFLMIAGHEWIINMAADYIPNKTKAVLYEVLGVLPALNESWTMNKNGNQIMIFPEWMNIMDDKALVFKNKYNTTKASFAGLQVLQSEDLHSVQYVKQFLVELKGLKEFDIDKESSPEGPFATTISSQGHVGFLWRNEICAISLNNIIPEADSAAARMLDACVGVDLTGKQI